MRIGPVATPNPARVAFRITAASALKSRRIHTMLCQFCQEKCVGYFIIHPTIFSMHNILLFLHVDASLVILVPTGT